MAYEAPHRSPYVSAVGLRGGIGDDGCRGHKTRARGGLCGRIDSEARRPGGRPRPNNGFPSGRKRAEKGVRSLFLARHRRRRSIAQAASPAAKRTPLDGSGTAVTLMNPFVTGDDQLVPESTVKYAADVLTFVWSQ